MSDRSTATRTSRRVAAVAALACLGALCIVVAVFVIRNVGALVVGLAGLSIAVVGAWWLVSEQGARRAVGAVGLGCGLVLMTIALAVPSPGVTKIVVGVVIVAVLLSVGSACARYALTYARYRVEGYPRPDGAPRHAVLLCNPWSGGGKVERFGLIDLAAQLGVETVLLERGLDLEQLARDAIARGADCLGMAGGDGSQALVASIAVAHGLPFVCVSAGTRNHFALDLGLNRDDPRQSMYAFRDAIERRVDYATVNDRVFVNNVSLGVYAKIVQEESYRDAKVQTTQALLPEMLGRQAEPFDLQFTTPTGATIDGAILVMVSNNPYVIGASPDNAQRRRLDSGRLGVFSVTTSSGAEAARLIAATATGQRRRSAFWQEFTTTSFEVRSRSGHAFAGVDGEALDLPTPLRFEIQPRGLTLLVPAGNLEAAERRQARDVVIGDLLNVAAGRQPRDRS